MSHDKNKLKKEIEKCLSELSSFRNHVPSLKELSQYIREQYINLAKELWEKHIKLVKDPKGYRYYVICKTCGFSVTVPSYENPKYPQLVHALLHELNEQYWQTAPEESFAHLRRVFNHLLRKRGEEMLELIFYKNRVNILLKDNWELTKKISELEKKLDALKEPIPIGAFACFIKNWDPPNTCHYEIKSGIECNWRRFCERLTLFVDWKKGYRPKASTLRKFLCKHCKLLSEVSSNG